MNASPHRITVVGAGYVGLVTAVGLASLGHAVEIVETREDRLAALRRGEVPIHEAGLQDGLDSVLRAGRVTVSDHPTESAPGLVMVCVGTPIGEDGQSDLSQLRDALRSLAPQLEAGATLVIRSTLPVGTTKVAVEWAGVPTRRVFTNPEFLRQGSALADFLHPTRIVIGRFEDADPRSLALLREVLGAIDAPLRVVDVAAAEIIKNGANAFLGLKLSFTNEIASLCEEYGTDAGPVLDGITLDPRIGTQFMQPSLGFGGSCLPKELVTLALAGQARDLPMYVTIAASAANLAQQRRFADRIAFVAGGLTGKTVALLGLAFKADTDDVRYSPALGVARMLLDAGARIRAYDPAAAANAARELPALEIAGSALDALDGADIGVIATEWREFADLDWVAARRHMVVPVIVDGRRILDPGAMRALGFRVETLGSGDSATLAATRSA